MRPMNYITEFSICFPLDEFPDETKNLTPAALREWADEKAGEINDDRDEFWWADVTNAFEHSLGFHITIRIDDVEGKTKATDVMRNRIEKLKEFLFYEHIEESARKKF